MHLLISQDSTYIHYIKVYPRCRLLSHLLICFGSQQLQQSDQNSNLFISTLKVILLHLDIQEVFHVYLNNFEIAVTQLFLFNIL